MYEAWDLSLKAPPFQVRQENTETHWPGGNEMISLLLGQQAPNNPPKAEFPGES